MSDEIRKDQLTELFLQAPAAIALLSGHEHRFSFVNLAFLLVTGRKRAEDFLGRSAEEALPEFAEQGFVRLLDEAYRAAQPQIGTEAKVIFRSQDSAASEQYFDFAFQPVRDRAGKVEGILIHAIDVTEKVRGRQAIERSEQRLRLAHTAAQIGTWEWNPTEDTRELSPETFAMFGTSPDDPGHALRWAERVHPEDWPSVQAFMEQGARSGSIEFEYRYNHPEHGQRWFYCKGRRLPNERRILGAILDVTDRKRAEEARQQSEQRLRAIVETTPESVKLLAPDGAVLYMNEAGLNMVQGSAETVIGKNVLELIAPEDRQKFRAFNQKICSGEKGSLDYDIVTLLGKRRHMETHAAPLQQPDGKWTQLAVTRDVTERTETSRASGRLAAIVDSSDDAIISKNLDGVITSWNRAAERLFGYAADEAVGRPIGIIIPPDREQEEREILAHIRSGERVNHFETVRIAKDGSLREVSLTISPVKDPSGRTVGASKIARDISERKRAERRERQITAEAVAARAKFRAVFEQTTQFAGIMDNAGVLVEANKMSLEACGYRAEEVLGLPFWQTAWWRNFPASQEKIRAAISRVAEGTPYRDVLRYSWADGSEHLLDFALYPITDSRGEVLFLHPTGVDITEAKRAEERYLLLVESLDAEVRARTRQLEERNREVLEQSEQLRLVSWRLLNLQDDERRRMARELHDSAGQTLTVLGMTLATISERAKHASPELVAMSLDARQLVRQLTNEIRTTSYLLHPPLLDESGLPSALAVYVEGLVQRSGIDIQCHVPRNFGRLPQKIEIAVFRVVQECLNNIHRHSGSKTATISIQREPDRVSVQVRDAGNGISPDKLADIQAKGSGVGIRGMRERLRQFGGELLIESTGAGTTVTVTIPVPDAEAIPPGAEIDTQPSAV